MIVVEALVALLLLASGAAALVAALGLLRLPDFFMRMHAPAIATTLGVWAVSGAAILHFSFGGGQLALHAWAVMILLSVAAPVTTVLLTRAALFRSRQAGEPVPPPLGREGEG